MVWVVAFDFEWHIDTIDVEIGGGVVGCLLFGSRLAGGR